MGGFGGHPTRVGKCCVNSPIFTIKSGEFICTITVIGKRLTPTGAFDSLPVNSPVMYKGVGIFIAASRNVGYQSRVDSCM